MWNYRMQRRYYRAQRRAYRRQRRGHHGRGFVGLIVFVVILIALNHPFWMLVPLILFGIPLFLFVLRPLLANAMKQSSYNQPYQQYQPYQQEPIYQPYQQQQPQEDPPMYQPYSQGYQPQQPVSTPGETEQGNSQQYRDFRQQQTPQYEDPLTMYPRE
jgi:multisubunit Na+/H+ antiporter MnhG subunit